MAHAYDIFMNKVDPSTRLAVLPGTGLPSHLHPDDWELVLPPDSSPVVEEAADGIKARAFSYFKIA